MFISGEVLQIHLPSFFQAYNGSRHRGKLVVTNYQLAFVPDQFSRHDVAAPSSAEASPSPGASGATAGTPGSPSMRHSLRELGYTREFFHIPLGAIAKFVSHRPSLHHSDLHPSIFTPAESKWFPRNARPHVCVAAVAPPAPTRPANRAALPTMCTCLWSPAKTCAR